MFWRENRKVFWVLTRFVTCHSFKNVTVSTLNKVRLVLRYNHHFTIARSASFYHKANNQNAFTIYSKIIFLISLVSFFNCLSRCANTDITF